MTNKKIALNLINQLKSQLEKYYLTSDIIEKNYNFEFSLNINRNIYKVLVYFGKKGVKTILQGNTELPEYITLRKLIFGQLELDYNDENLSEPDEYIGTDESGKGDYFGPLVVAAVYVDLDTQKKLKQIGVRDSKDLSENQISDLSKEILKIVKENYSIVTISPQKYNQLYDKFKNLNHLLNWAHSKAIENLLKKTKCDTVITDKFSKRELNISFNKNHSSIKFIQETKAEKFVGVAAASILARNKFNEWFIKNSNDEIELIKGTSKKVEKAAAELVKKYGKESLNKFVKLHFKTTNNILNK
ncbi:ribonuclease HIII [Rosettibacter firmus]|uniref:ribonuclease HIII n=1 Tax=Rosettibacter firmus TaxID=3111522 RepID=UPI00336C045C